MTVGSHLLKGKAKLNGNPKMTPEYARALDFARNAHEGQFDKAGKPYIAHPVRVAGLVDDPTAKIAALLHDVVEDCGVTLGDLEEQFGADVARIVDSLTRRDGETYTDFIDRCAQTNLAREVKLADLTDNMDLSRMANPGPEDFSRLERYRKAYAKLIKSKEDAGVMAREQ